MPEDFGAIELPPARVWARGGARPVLALHCSLAHAGAWAGLAEALDGVTITATDQPGHGRAADWDGTCDLHRLTTDGAVAMAENLGQGAAIDFFGHSFGGTVALRVALERPDLVRSLTLVEPVIFAAAKGSTGYAAFEAAHFGFEDMVKSGHLAEAAALFHAQWGTGDSLADLPERTRDYMIKRIGFIVAQHPYLFDDASHLLREGGLESIKVPVLLIEGGRSPAVIDAINQVLAARLPHAKRLVVPEAAHMVSITHPQAVAPAVQAHLAGC